MIKPHDFQSALLNWYDQHKRDLPWRNTDDPYAVWISEVMLQQTQVNTVIPYYNRFLSRFPDPATLASADLQEVLKLWEGLGYYSRARNLHKAAAMIVETFDGRLPDHMDQMLDLPGVGDYIASAVLSIAYGKIHAVVDGNVKRVLARVLQIEDPVNKPSSHKVYKAHASRLISPDRPADYNQAIMEIGALTCRPKNPICSDCPLSKWCASFLEGTVSRFPKRVEKPKTPRHSMVIGVVMKEDKLLLVKRPEGGLLGGMWEFPGARIQKKRPQESDCAQMLLEETGLSVCRPVYLTRINHAYTHFKITADVFLCEYGSGTVRLKSHADVKWVSMDMLNPYPIHKANQKFLPALEAYLKKADDGPAAL